MKFLRQTTLALAVLALSGAAAATAHAQMTEGLKALEAGEFRAAATAFAKGFEAKQPEAGFYLGRMFELGLGTQPNRERAVALYSAAAQMDSILAANRLGMMHLGGDGVLQDFERARSLFETAATPTGDNPGNINAQFNLGSLYWQGIGAEADKAKALAWYELAAAQGSVAASNALGLALLEGNGTDADPALAYAHFADTAAQGNPVGLYQLGLLHENGFGADRSSELAYLHFNLASARGHPAAAQARDRVGVNLDVNALQTAQAQAREWAKLSPAERLNQFYGQ